MKQHPEDALEFWPLLEEPGPVQLEGGMLAQVDTENFWNDFEKGLTVVAGDAALALASGLA